MFNARKVLSAPTRIFETPERSDLSQAFETMWLGLERKNGPVPFRSAFLPERAARMLPRIALLEIHAGAPMTTNIRLVGSTLRMLADFDLTGHDFLDMVADREYHASRIRTCMTHPCATWSAAPIIYERGSTSLIEITNFPLIDDATNGYLSLALLNETDLDLPAQRTVNKPIELHPAIINDYIDIGAGLPPHEAAPGERLKAHESKERENV